MKVFFRVLIAIVIMPVLLSMTACSTNKEHTYSSKKLISLQDVEKLLKDDGIEIVNRGPSFITQRFLLQLKELSDDNCG